MGPGGARGEPSEVCGEDPLRIGEDHGKKEVRFKPQAWRRDEEKMLLGNSEGSKPSRKPTCVHCQSNEHFGHSCTRVLDEAARRAILQRNRMCNNCTVVGHEASQCRSRGCKNCQGKHHTSIYEQVKSTVDFLQNPRVEKGMSS